MEALLQISVLRRTRKKIAASIRWAARWAAGTCKHNGRQVAQTRRTTYKNKQH